MMDRSGFWRSLILFILNGGMLAGLVRAAGEPSTILPPNFVPMIDGATVKPATLPDILTVQDDKGKICTLASLDATIVLWPGGDESREVRIEMPDSGVSASPGGNQKCSGDPSPSKSDGSKPLLVVGWSSFQLCFYISKTEVNWAVDRIVFAFNSSEVPLGSLKSEVKVFENEPDSLEDVIKAPLDFSYRCWAAKSYPMRPVREDKAAGNATLLLSNFQLEPFLSSELQVFGEETVCREDRLAKRRRRHRDNTVTVAVGSTLTVVSLVTVLGYGIYRHLKLKAVGYGTME